MRNTRIILNPALIKQTRLNMGLSQKRWALALGISEKLASKCETGKSISQDTLDKIAGLTGIHPESLLDNGICPYCGAIREEETNE
jgi:transcriptional regulator with XRE-family HTH domain